MANSSVTFSSRGTRVFHGKAGGAIPICRFVSRDVYGNTATMAQLVLTPSGSRPVGVSPATFAAGDDADYHRSGICAVECLSLTSAAIGSYVKADGSGTGKAIVDHATTPTVLAAGVLLTFDATTNIGDVELSF
jgi:hypothetical protein